jgi:hypothetical protein
VADFVGEGQFVFAAVAFVVHALILPRKRLQRNEQVGKYWIPETAGQGMTSRRASPWWCRAAFPPNHYANHDGNAAASPGCWLTAHQGAKMTPSPRRAKTYEFLPRWRPSFIRYCW